MENIIVVFVASICLRSISLSSKRWWRKPVECRLRTHSKKKKENGGRKIHRQFGGKAETMSSSAVDAEAPDLVCQLDNVQGLVDAFTAVRWKRHQVFPIFLPLSVTVLPFCSFSEELFRFSLCLSGLMSLFVC